MSQLYPNNAVPRKVLVSLLETIRTSIPSVNEQFIEKAINPNADILDVQVGLFCEYANLKTNLIVEDCLTLINIEGKTFYSLDNVKIMADGLFSSLSDDCYEDLDKLAAKIEVEHHRELLKEVGAALIACYVETKDLLAALVIQDDESKEKIVNFFEENSQ